MLLYSSLFSLVKHSTRFKWRLIKVIHRHLLLCFLSAASQEEMHDTILLLLIVALSSQSIKSRSTTGERWQTVFYCSLAWISVRCKVLWAPLPGGFLSESLVFLRIWLELRLSGSVRVMRRHPPVAFISCLFKPHLHCVACDDAKRVWIHLYFINKISFKRGETSDNNQSESFIKLKIIWRKKM